MYLQEREIGLYQVFFSNQYHDVSAWEGNNSKNQQEKWESVFGDKGSCQHLTNQILLVAGYDVEITSYANYSEQEYQQIIGEGQLKVWPFYLDVKGGTENIKYNEKEKSITTGAPDSALQIFGVGVIPTSKAMGVNTQLISSNSYFFTFLNSRKPP